jgi:hypothetical protein
MNRIFVMMKNKMISELITIGSMKNHHIMVNQSYVLSIQLILSKNE